MHEQEVNTENSKKQTGEVKSLFDFASDLETTSGNLSAILKSARKELCGDTDHSIMFALVDSAERFAGDVRQITQAMYGQTFEKKQPAAVPRFAKNADTDPPVNINPLHHAIAAMGAAGLGMFCVEEITTLLESIEALANVQGLSQIEMQKRLNAIQRTAQLAVRFADDRHNTIDCEREKLEEAVNALKEAGHV